MSTQIWMTAAQVNEAFASWADEISHGIPDDCTLVIVGIKRRGDLLAKRLMDALPSRQHEVVHGALDITLYRDDLAEIGPSAVLRGTEIPVTLEGKRVLLVDDVIFTARSVRAALTGLADFGRARTTRLAVFVDRGGRELPIQPDFVAARLEQPVEDVNVKLREVDGVDAIELEAPNSQ